MLRYIALAWNAADREQDDTAKLVVRRIQCMPTDWRCGLDRDDIKVFYAGALLGTSEPYILHDHAGVVLGTLFECEGSSSSAPRKPVLGPQETARIVANCGRSLVKSYWGRYVAILRDGRTGKRWVLRDPTGGLPCLAARFRGVDIFFSCIEDAASLELLKFSLNWQYIMAQMIAGHLETRETGLLEVSKLLAGECLEIHRGSTSKCFYWDPFPIARSGRIDNPEKAAALLRETVGMCVGTWASRYDSILHRLSGGLDSSIVLGCLRNLETRPQITCLNYYSAGADSDEREFARLAARHAGVELIEEERDSRVSLEAMVRMPRVAEPRFFTPLHLQRRELEARLAHEHGAASIFDGTGGDGLFYQNPITATVADYLHDHGPRPTLFRIALDAARMDQVSVWSVLRTATAYRLGRRRWNAFDEAYRALKLMQQEAIDAIEPARLLHPWFHERADVPPGKLWHILNMSIPLNIEGPLASAGGPEQVEPLISQPVFELCLRIPTYVLAAGGWDRALARRAFAHEVPVRILRRRWKGGIEEHIKQVVFQNIKFIRDLLLNGILVREKLVDRKKLEDVLSGDPSKIAVGFVELLTHLSTEAWLTTWGDAQKRAAA